MSITLTLPKKLERELNDEAKARQKELPDYLVELIHQARDTSSPRFKSTTEVLAYWQAEGLINTRPRNTNSQQLARKLRKQAGNRKR